MSTTGTSATGTSATGNATPLRPVPAVIGIVLRERDVLLVRRANPPDAGCWGFPGGKIEPGEPLADAVVREIAEETTVDVEALDAFTALDGSITTRTAPCASISSWSRCCADGCAARRPPATMRSTRAGSASTHSTATICR